MRLTRTLDLTRAVTVFEQTRLPEIGLSRTVAVLHGRDLTPRVRVSYHMPNGDPIPAASVYLHVEWVERILAAILACRLGERVDMHLGRGTTHVWSATENGERGLCLTWRPSPHRRAPVEREGDPAPPSVALVGDELEALEAALTALATLAPKVEDTAHSTKKAQVQ